MKRLVIYGAGGHAREVLALIRDINLAGSEPEWDVLGFIDDAANGEGRLLNGLPVLGTGEWIRNSSRPLNVVLGMGSPAVKRRIAERLRGHVAAFPVLVHPSVISSEHVRYGEGVVVSAGCILTVDIILSDFVTLNRMSMVSHDCRVGPYATLAPGVRLSGNVQVGTGCDIGTGTSVIQGISIGDWSVVGAGAAVVRDVPANCTAVGVPARVIKQRQPRWHEEAK